MKKRKQKLSKKGIQILSRRAWKVLSPSVIDLEVTAIAELEGAIFCFQNPRIFKLGIG